MNWTTLLISIGGWIVTLVGYIMVDRREKTKQMDSFKSEIVKTLNDHRTEYLKGIEDVKDDITDLRALYQQNQAIVELKIDALEKKQDVHNNLIARMYEVEKKIDVLEALEKK